MEKTKIEWAYSSWNPVTGCYNQCEYCYARTMVRRFSGVKIGDGRGNLFVLDEPYISADGKTRPYPYEFLPTFHRYRLGDYEKKKGRTIFVCSMADLFGEWVPDEWIEQIFEACAKAPQHRYLFLTKNPKRYIDLELAGKLPHSSNMWYGTTVPTEETQYFFVDRLNAFISVEPMLSDFTGGGGLKHIRWVVAGAETGNRKGKVTPKKKWVEHLVEACAERGVPLFMKDSLSPIIGEENMKREFPWEVEQV